MRGSPTTRVEEESLEELEGPSKGSLSNPSLVCGMTQIDCDEESPESEAEGGSAVDNSIADYSTGGFTSRLEIPYLLTLLVDNMGKELAGDSQEYLAGSPAEELPTTSYQFTSEGLRAKREEIRVRVHECAQLAMATSTYGLRIPKKNVDYAEGGRKVNHPNWKHFEGKIRTSPINEKLVGAKKKGYGRLVVKESLIPALVTPDGGSSRKRTFARGTCAARMKAVTYLWSTSCQAMVTKTMLLWPSKTTRQWNSCVGIVRMRLAATAATPRIPSTRT